MGRLVVAIGFVVAGSLAAAAPSVGHARAKPGHGILFVYRPHSHAEGGDIYDSLPGGGLQRITHSANAKFDPQWSPSGRQIAYTAMQSNGLGSCGPCIEEVWVARSDGSRAHQVTSLPSNDAPSNTRPSWSPDGNQIVFERDAAVPPIHQLLVVPARGGRERKLVIAGTNPSWGKAGIAYAFGDSIRLISPRTRRPKLFASAATGVAALAWSQSDELAALEGSAYGRRVVIYKASGRRVARFRIPAPLFGAFGIAWSPDGKHLLLSAWVRGARPGLYETDPEGVRLRHVVARINACCASWR